MRGKASGPGSAQNLVSSMLIRSFLGFLPCHKINRSYGLFLLSSFHGGKGVVTSRSPELRPAAISDNAGGEAPRVYRSCSESEFADNFGRIVASFDDVSSFGTPLWCAAS